MTAPIDARAARDTARFECVLFDHDETLLSTLALRVRTMEQTAVDVLDRTLDGAAFIEASHGQSLEQMASGLTGGDGALASRFVEHYRALYYAANGAGLRVFDGIPEALATLSRAGLRIAVVTAKLGRGARGELESTGLADHVETVVGSEDVTRTKPDAEPLLKALTRLDVAAEQALMVGDTSADLLGARAAGTASAAALWGVHDRAALLAHRPDYAFEHPEALVAMVLGGFAAPDDPR